jgi:hypothetical protein
MLILSPVWLRALSFILIPPGMNNTYKQHYFLGEFIRQNPNTNIAVNDIGIMSYYSNARITDLWGLANKKTASERLSFSYNTASISGQVRNDKAGLCILYEEWYKQFGGLPSDWIKIGEWYFKDYNLISGSHKIDFYVPDKNNADKFRNILKDFFGQLPNSVQKNIY